MFEGISNEHLLNIRKIVDDMAMQAAMLQGCIEALRLLFPNFANSSANNQVFQSVRQMHGAMGMPLPLWLAETSRVIGEELRKRKVIE